MTLQQLYYVIAIDKHRHFAKAAQECGVTQPTLSMMVQKIEQELQIKIFDRSNQPLVTTEVGRLIIDQAHVIINESNKLLDISQRFHKDIQGSLRIGIIPTLSPYLVPLFLKRFVESYPKVQLEIYEYLTEDIIKHLNKDFIDAGIFATPVHRSELVEEPLFTETFSYYSQECLPKSFINPQDVKLDNLWLLPDGHCMYNQIYHFCESSLFRKRSVQYRASSLEGLIQLVDHQGGATILPELCIHTLSNDKKAMVIPFEDPAPAREISLVVYRSKAKELLINALKRTIIASIPVHLCKNKRVERMPVFLNRS